MTTTSASSVGSVLLSFRAENVRSFRDELEFSLVATRLAEQAVIRRVPWHSGGKTVDVLPCAGVFGANASGKTNLLRVMSDMRSLVLGSFRHGQPHGGIQTHPFMLDGVSQDRPSRFEIELVLEGVRHEYGFIVDKSEVLEEWAFYYPNGRAALLFRRSRGDVEIGAAERTKGRAVRELLRPNALFLSTAASANHPLLLPLYAWFSRNLLLAEAGSRGVRQAYTAQLLEDEQLRPQVLRLLRAADLGITGASRKEYDQAFKARLERAVSIITGEEDESDDVGQTRVELEDFEVRLTHRGAEGEVEFHPLDESLGTLVWFGLAGPIVTALAQGAVLLADELDASLHPALVQQIVRLFQQPSTNPRRAQIIFNSHDVTLLGESVAERLLGRDQVWFTEKLDTGDTRLYPLTELDPRRDESVVRRYLAGRYGGMPILNEHEFDDVADLISSGAPD